MKDFLKTKAVTGVIVMATLLLAGVAVFTALRLYQLRQESLSPLSPESAPEAGQQTTPQACQTLTFNLTQDVSPTVVASPTDTPANSPTPTDNPVGGGDPTPTNSPTPTTTPKPTATLTPTDTPLGGTSPTPTTVAEASLSPTTGLIAQASPTVQPGTGGANEELPAAGASLPTILTLAIGVLMIIAAFIFAL